MNMPRTEQQMIDANRGYHDGIQSQSLANHFHTLWPEGNHFNSDYESGYWTGFIGASLPHPDADFSSI
jgi:hypothetical protein